MRGAALVGAALVLAGCGGRSLFEHHEKKETFVDAGRDADAADASADTVDAGDAPDAGDAGDRPPAPGFVIAPPTVDCAGYGDVSTCVVRVKPGGGAGAGDAGVKPGMSWDTALASVQDALDYGSCGCDVWIAAGTYTPTKSIEQPGEPPDPRARAFVVWPGSTVLGGFAGTETSPTGRPTSGAETILSGDLGVAGARDDNAYHVVVTQDGTALESLTIRDGVADGFGIGQGVGGGVVNTGGLSLRNVKLTDNEADTGGGLFDEGDAHVTAQGCTFARNTANLGGGLIVSGGASTIDRSTFEDNVGVFVGGGVAQFGGTVELSDTKFFRNRSDTGGGAAFSAGTNRVERCWFETNAAGSFGAGFIVRTGATVHVSSSVFVANASVGFGGALALWTGTLELEASTVVDNFAAMGGAFLVKDGSRLTIGDSVVWHNLDPERRTVYFDGKDNTLTATTSDVPADFGNAALNFEADPRLANVPRASRLAQLAGTTDTVVVTDAAKLFVPGDRLELGDDGVEREVVSFDDIEVKFTPARSVATPRWLRVDLWDAAAPSLTQDLAPTAASPLLDNASSGAPPIDVFGHARVGPADLGAIERVP